METQPIQPVEVPAGDDLTDEQIQEQMETEV